MSHQAAPHSSQPDWPEAASRVRAFLQALAVASPARRDQVTAMVLRRAASRYEENTDVSPTALAMYELRSQMEQWLAKLIAPSERAGVMGIVSLAAMDAASQWPEAFLAEEIPADFHRALWACDVHAVPGLKVSTMVPQPFPNPLQAVVKLAAPLEKLTHEVAPVATKMVSGLLIRLH